MNKLVLLSAMLIIPASLFAELNFDVTISGNTHLNSYYDDCDDCDYDYVDDGDPWFEESQCRGPARVSLEYQWSLLGPRHVLRYREVTFNTFNNQWTFGPWLIKEPFCHSSCNLHHHHAFYIHKEVNPFWKRYFHNDGGRVTCYYEFNNHRNYHGPANVYRYEYHPERYQFHHMRSFISNRDNGRHHQKRVIHEDYKPRYNRIDKTVIIRDNHRHNDFDRGNQNRTYQVSDRVRNR